MTASGEKLSERWVTQTEFHDPADDTKGNCTEAAVASLLNRPLDSIPNFRRLGEQTGNSFWPTLRRWFREQGYHFMPMRGSFIPDCLYLASGPSPRGVSHMVVMRAGELVHDPHPSRAGLVSVEDAYLVIPIDIGAAGRRALQGGDNG